MSDTATVEGTGGLRPLHLAAKKGHDLLCKALLMAGADADAPQEIQGQYYSALHHAAAKGHTETTRILMRFGADPHEGAGGWTPLQLAEHEKQDAAVEVIREELKTSLAQVCPRPRSRLCRPVPVYLSPPQMASAHSIELSTIATMSSPTMCYISQTPH